MENGVDQFRTLLRQKKIGFLDGTIKKPTDIKELPKWVQVNSMIGAWIHNTLDTSIRSTVPLTDSVTDIYDDLKQHFSIGNGPCINELKRQISNCDQQGDSVVIYYRRIRKLWEELAVYMASPCSYKCDCGATKEREDEKVHQFLIDLDSVLYGNVQSNVLIQDPLPSLNTVFFKAMTQERNLAISRTTDKKNETVGFAMQGALCGQGTGTGKGSERPRTYRTCTHCEKFGHGQDTCFELLGYPDWWFAENRAATRGKERGGRGGRAGNSRGRGTNVANAVGQGPGNNPTSQHINDGDRTGLPSVSNEQ